MVLSQEVVTELVFGFSTLDDLSALLSTCVSFQPLWKRLSGFIRVGPILSSLKPRTEFILLNFLQGLTEDACVVAGSSALFLELYRTGICPSWFPGDVDLWVPSSLTCVDLLEKIIKQLQKHIRNVFGHSYGACELIEVGNGCI